MSSRYDVASRASDTATALDSRSALHADPAASRPFRLGEWSVFPALNRVEREGVCEQLEPRIMRVLVCLASCPGEVVSRQTLMSLVWGDVVVGEEVLTRAISRLRTILDDTPSTPRLIETIRGGGYRLLVGVIPIEGATTLDCPGAATCELGDPARERGARSGRRSPLAGWPLLVLAGGLVLSVAAAILVVIGPGTAANQTQDAPVAIQLTSEARAESMPAISPNGLMVAYTASRPGSSRFDIWVRQIDTEEAIRITESTGEDLFPTWSPDGGRIAFARHDDEGARLLEVSPLGGAVRVLCQGGHVIEGLSWSPDGSEIVLSTGKPEGSGQRLSRLTLDSLELAPITEPPAVFAQEMRFDVGDTDPAFSPDGRTIAFTRSDATGLEDVYLMPASGGAPRRLTSGLRLVMGLAWASDGSQLVVSAAPRGQLLLWRVSVADGSSAWLPSLRSDAIRPTIDHRRERLIFGTRYSDTDIWRYRLLPGGAGEPMEEPVIVSTAVESWPVPSHDGRWLAFVSNRTGPRQLWVADASGESLRQITSFDGVLLERPKWSPDGTWIALSSVHDGQLAIHVIEVATGLSRRIEPAAPHEQLLEWSPGGDWIYYDVAEGDCWEIWRMRVDGSGRERVDHPRAELRTIRFLGPYMYYSTAEHDGVWRWPLDGGEAEKVVEQALERSWATWAVTYRGIYFLARGDEENRVKLLDLQNGTVTPTAMVFPPNTTLMVFYKDGLHVLIARFVRADSDLILLEHPVGL
jgi:Tol biopolymer transport system component/DNA-binding winged helix-turn-helix (wHTH) protein